MGLHVLILGLTLTNLPTGILAWRMLQSSSQLPEPARRLQHFAIAVAMAVLGLLIGVIIIVAHLAIELRVQTTQLMTVQEQLITPEGAVRVELTCPGVNPKPEIYHSPEPPAAVPTPVEAK